MGVCSCFSIWKYCSKVDSSALCLTFVFFFLSLFAPTSIFSQNKAADKANELYQLEQYSAAANYYEEAITEMKNKSKSARHLLNLQSKLAFCYRANNRMEEAEAVYAEVVENDRAKSSTYFFYGETLMANGKYDEAKKWFLDYQKLEPEDEKAPLMIRACEEVKNIQPFFEFVEVHPFEHNSDADDNASVAWQEGVVFSSDRSTNNKIKVNLLEEKSGWTGRDYLDIYFSARQTDGTFGQPKQFSAKLSELNKNTGNTSFSLDGKVVFFSRNDNVLNKQKTYNLQLFRAEYIDGRWRNVEKLPFCSPNYNFMHPAISPDGEMLFFVSDKGGGQGGTDIWVSILDEDNKWGKPENLGHRVNTPANEGFPFMDAYGRLYFCSKGHVGYGGFDIFFSDMSGNGNWKNPTNLGKPINSPVDDISIYVDSQRKNGMFSSSRKGGDDDIFFFNVLTSAPPKPETDVSLEAEENEATTVLQITPPSNEEKEVTISESAQIQELVEEPLTKAESPKEEPKIVAAESVAINTEDTEKNLETSINTKEEEVSLVEEDTSSVPETETTPTIIPTTLTVEKTERLKEDKDFALESFNLFEGRIIANELKKGNRFRLDNAVFDPNVWQLTPRVSKKLDELVSIMQRFPFLHIELSAHTDSRGLDEENLLLSQNRAETAAQYLIREGIGTERLQAIGYGESMLLNECKDGASCKSADHLFNQRLEVKVLSIKGGE